jgi:hypothetical protein
MPRRPLGRGRTLAVAGALVILAGALLPWYAFQVDAGLPAMELRAFDGSGILAFLAALGILALVTLPYAAGDRPIPTDRGLAYGLLAGVAGLGVAVWPLQVIEDLSGLLPAGAAGWWIAVIGVAILARGTFEITREPARIALRR